MADMLRELTGMPAEEGACRAPTSNAEPAEYCCTIIAHDALRQIPHLQLPGFWRWLAVMSRRRWPCFLRCKAVRTDRMLVIQTQYFAP